MAVRERVRYRSVKIWVRLWARRVSLLKRELWTNCQENGVASRTLMRVRWWGVALACRHCEAIMSLDALLPTSRPGVSLAFNPRQKHTCAFRSQVQLIPGFFRPVYFQAVGFLSLDAFIIYHRYHAWFLSAFGNYFSVFLISSLFSLNPGHI